MRERTSTSVDARQRTLTDTYNICKCYMLMIFSVIIYVIIYVIKMQIKHVIISSESSLTILLLRQRVMVRYNCVKMTLKSNLS